MKKKKVVKKKNPLQSMSRSDQEDKELIDDLKRQLNEALDRLADAKENYLAVLREHEHFKMKALADIETLTQHVAIKAKPIGYLWFRAPDSDGPIFLGDSSQETEVLGAVFTVITKIGLYEAALFIKDLKLQEKATKAIGDHYNNPDMLAKMQARVVQILKSQEGK